jgi:hypothetical protein
MKTILNAALALSLAFTLPTHPLQRHWSIWKHVPEDVFIDPIK